MRVYEAEGDKVYGEVGQDALADVNECRKGVSSWLGHEL